MEDFFPKKKLGSKQQLSKDFYDGLTGDEVVDEEFYKTLKDHLALKIKIEGVDAVLSGPATLSLFEFVKDTVFFNADTAKMHHRYAEIIFSLAKEWRKMYRAYKDEHHLIDFNDMEEMFLELLGMPEVQEDIKSRYTHLYVDEFQDSNPMQVNIFQKLSELLDTCYVGDKKQAIYGFRGSDTKLTSAVADSISSKETLRCSYRSIEPLVNISNKVFTHVFDDMTENEVKLDMPEANGNTTEVDVPLRVWNWEKDKELALQIQQFILSEGVKPSDIAVLARKNDDLDKLADELRKLHVPVCRESNDLKESRTGRLIKALLTLVASPSNQLARAEVAYLTEEGYNVTKIIEDRLDNLKSEGGSSEYLKELPVLAKLNSLLRFNDDDSDEFGSRNILAYQSISALVETLIIELDLYSLVQRWKSSTAEETNLQVFVDLAKKYEDSATRQARPATVPGFIDFFTNQKQKGAADDEGVRLFTYHKSKGLEWKVVIMLSLGNDASDATNIATRCMLGCHNHRDTDPTPENTNPPMTISLVRNIYGTSNEAKGVLVARLQKHPLWNAVSQQEIGESARLLYVGVTRARDILILAPQKGDLNWFRSVGLTSVVPTVLAGMDSLDVLGVEVPFKIETVNPADLKEWPEPSVKKVLDLEMGGYSYLNNNKFVSPSKAGKTSHEIRIINDKEYRMEVKNKDAEAQMGDFIHQVFCCMDDKVDVPFIERLREEYGFDKEHLPEPSRLIEAWNYLVDTLTKQYGPAVKRHHEVPFRHNDADGRVVSGYIDFIWETEDSYVIVDYKTCPGSYSLVFKAGSEHYAGNHGDQLGCYQRAIESMGSKTVKAKVIYYPVTRFMTEVL